MMMMIMVLHKKQTVKNVPTNRKEKVYNKQYVVCFLLQE